MDFSRLRTVLRPLVVALHDIYTQVRFPELYEALGLTEPEHGRSKREVVTNAFDLLTDEQLPITAERLLIHHPPSPGVRNVLQDLLCADLPTPVVPRKFRREIGRRVDIGRLYLDGAKFDALLDKLWVSDSDVELALQRPFSREALSHLPLDDLTRGTEDDLLALLSSKSEPKRRSDRSAPMEVASDRHGVKPQTERRQTPGIGGSAASIRRIPLARFPSRRPPVGPDPGWA